MSWRRISNIFIPKPIVFFFFFGHPADLNLYETDTIPDPCDDIEPKLPKNPSKPLFFNKALKILNYSQFSPKKVWAQVI